MSHLNFSVMPGFLTKWTLPGLLPAYSIALYLHRFLENSLAPAFAKRVLETSAWSQIIVGGSNFGEVRPSFCTKECRAYNYGIAARSGGCLVAIQPCPDPDPLVAFRCARCTARSLQRHLFHTDEPEQLNIVWVLPAFAKIATKDVTWAWKIAGCFIPISMGWAAGDVSLAAYIQSTLSQAEYRGCPSNQAMG